MHSPKGCYTVSVRVRLFLSVCYALMSPIIMSLNALRVGYLEGFGFFL